MEDRKIDILGVCETRTKQEGQKKLHNDYVYIYKGNEEGKHGVGFVLRPAIAGKVNEIIYKNERIISISIDLKTEGISLIMISAPQQGRTVEEKEGFYGEMQETYENVRYGNTTVILGDWNGHVGRESLEGVLGAFSIGNRNAEGSRITDFCIMNGLSIMNTYYKHRDSHKWTWYRWNEIEQRYTDKSMIDLFVTNNKKLFCDVKSIPSASMNSDHRMVIAKMRMLKPIPKKKKKTRRLKLKN